ncbi:MAG: protein N-lysine methyltransferase family protein [Desulfobulbaceae bacterium]|nr:protein N-lysine methyltransferase family protein [Desulfobulbaceae bacterium]HIJ78442.1 methyltransferase domain-containing protein [Deltaproteobacteria bacterium]
MDPTTLPEKEYKRLREIRKKYKVDFEPLKVRDKEIQLLQVTDLEPLLAGKDPFKDVEDFPFWVKLWEAAMVLADLMVTMPPPKKDATLLELGAGLGAPGLAAALNGYQVTISDYEPHILDFERVSAAASGLSGVQFKLIDWLKPPDLPKFDMIIGAEILFREEFFTPLLTVFKKLLAPDGVIYLAHDIRRKSMPKFLLQAEKEYVIATSKRTMRSDDKETVVIVSRLTPRH